MGTLITGGLPAAPRPEGSLRRSWAASAASAVGWVLLSLAAGAAGAAFMPDAWYAALRKPPWNPPNWVFGPVWTTLYVLMGLAAWRIWLAAPGRRRAMSLALFVAQLVANAAWTWMFFGLHRPGLALADLAVLWTLIAALIVAARPSSRLAAWMLAPYLAWVTFAASLNAAIWWLNG